MLNAAFLKSHFDRAHTFARYVATGKPAQQQAFMDIFERARLTPTRPRS
jgi:hypothetical protein